MFVAAMYAGKDVLHWFACLNIDMKTVFWCFEFYI